MNFTYFWDCFVVLHPLIFLQNNVAIFNIFVTSASKFSCHMQLRLLFCQEQIIIINNIT